MLKRLSILTAALSLGVFTGCQYSAQTPALTSPQPLPTSYDSIAADVSTAASNDPWWTSFERPDLDALESEALAGNLSLAEAWARLRAAQAQAVISGAGLFPSLGGEGSWSKGYEGNPSRTGSTEQWGLGTGISYEVDLWGRIRAQSESAQALVEFSQFDVQATALTLSGDVASAWLNILALADGMRLLQQQVSTNQTQLELVLLRFGNGQASALDVYQQKQLLAAAETIVPQVERQIRLYQHQLALLLGQPADWEFSVGTLGMPTMPPAPATCAPSDLLLQRPDVRAAYETLNSAEWNVAQARADRLPRVTLSADATTTAGAFADLFDSWSASFLAGLAQPLFDAGQRQAEVQRQLALAKQSLLQYRTTVLTAYKEVRDALVQEQWYYAELEAMDRQMEAAQQEFTEAQSRYLSGLTDYLDVTSSLSSLQTLQRQRISLIADLLQSRIDLHLALGGELPLTNPDPSPVLSPEDTIPLVPVFAELLEEDDNQDSTLSEN
ncbi:efflux transporter outer membrane subunit [Cerasicoccus fimbriatus]|uniref:efflux transporter outer membrane subunit n=1 Tax=Cerasicoccus fimbriatus TaxID=3014554 RepID=UPI0022B36944|nr:efflux transporter outer membrane subunit [Cerasicoccus sp. TK19100]